MKTTNRKPTLLSMAVGLAFGTTVAYTSAQAYDADYEISSAYDVAVNDTSYSVTPSIRVGGYRAETLIEESYHDYQSDEVIAYEADLVDLEQTEIAAFEVAEPSALPRVIPWQLRGTLD